MTETGAAVESQKPTILFVIEQTLNNDELAVALIDFLNNRDGDIKERFKESLEVSNIRIFIEFDDTKTTINGFRALKEVTVERSLAAPAPEEEIPIEKQKI